MTNNTNFKQTSNLSTSLGSNSPLTRNGKGGKPVQHYEKHQTALDTFPTPQLWVHNRSVQGPCVVGGLVPKLYADNRLID